MMGSSGDRSRSKGRSICRQLLIVSLVVGGAGVAAAGCADSVPASQPAQTASPAATSSGAPAGVQESPSGTRSAWVRGTNATLTNNSGQPVSVGYDTGLGGSIPSVEASALAGGSSVTATAEWQTDASGTAVYFLVEYPSSDGFQLRVANPAIGTPYVQYRDRVSTKSWSQEPGTTVDFDENVTKTLTIGGHPVTVTRGADDDDNKNWALVLTA